MELAVKAQGEIGGLLEGASRVAVIACKLCFKQFERDMSEEVGQVKAALAESGKEVVAELDQDFLCNLNSTGKAMAKLDLSGVDAVVTCCCGVGTQVVASLTDKPVIPAANTVGGTSYEGFEPVESKLCMACAQCVLNQTGGICPVAYCAKSLLNGPCGGAKNGKCEVNKEKECAWLVIYDRLKKTGRVQAMMGETRLRDHNRPTWKQRDKLSRQVAETRDLNFYGGVYPVEHKELTEQRPIEVLPAPALAVVPMIQHIGAPCRPTVRVGDAVKLGQLIGDTEGYVSAPIHSPVSGRVVAIEKRPHPVVGTDVEAVVIENDGLDTLDPSCTPCEAPQALSGDEIVEIVQARGLVGLGGAMFPTHVKLKPHKRVDTLIVNGCECEPFLTADHRVMVERADAVVRGMRLVAKAIGVSRCIIGIEDNKPDAAEAVRAAAGADAEVVVIHTKYPQGAERMLVKRLTGRQVPLGGLPLDVGIVVSNVSTCYAVYEAVCRGLPLTRRVITVSGLDVARPGNYEVRVGTPIREVLARACDRAPDALLSDRVIRMGGPMMGLAQSSIDAPVVKGTSGLTVLPQAEIEPDDQRRCVRCGRCVAVCPMELEPHLLWYYAVREDWETLKKLGVLDCIECGCCEYICASKLPLVSLFKRAKLAVRKLPQEK